MNKKQLFYIVLLVLSLVSFTFQTVYAQEEPDTADISSYTNRARQLVKYLEGTLNFLGDSTSPNNEKDIIINQSYLKMFQDDEVQIEDDLDENREVPINKDVQAYLKDIDFFFKYVHFEFNIEDITHALTLNNQLYLKVTLNRHMEGVTVKGRKVNSNRERFIEINVNPESRDLKIASIYTTRPNEMDEVLSWWESVPEVWKNIFGRYEPLSDSVTYEEVKRIIGLDEIDISGNNSVQTLEPLNRLTKLRKIDCSGTYISSLFPLRNLSDLEVLNCENTSVTSLDPMRYAQNLRELDCGGTYISDLAPVRNFTSLEILSCNDTHVGDLNPLAGIDSLKALNVSNTHIDSLDPLSHLFKLEKLDISHTRVHTLEPLNSLINLRVLDFNYTGVSDLTPLNNLVNLAMISFNNSNVSDLSPLGMLPDLQKIYCDNTLIEKVAANKFMQQHPGVLVIFESETLESWWNNLDPAWQQLFIKKMSFTGKPGTEQLHQLMNLAELDLSGIKSIGDIAPLGQLVNLKQLNLSHTLVKDLSAVSNMNELIKLDVSYTAVEDLSPLAQSQSLQELNISHTPVNFLEALRRVRSLKNIDASFTKVSGISSLSSIPSLETVNIDHADVEEDSILTFLDNHPNVLVLYHAEALRQWWNSLTPDWHEILEMQAGFQGAPDNEQLHRISQMHTLYFTNNYRIKSLEPVRQLKLLRELKFTETKISDLSPLDSLFRLEILNISGNPVSNIGPVALLNELSSFNCSETPVSELEPLSGLNNLQILNISGTQVKNLKALRDLDSLTYLDCSNTRIHFLGPVKYLENLQTLKCFNTPVFGFSLDNFRNANPDCEVVYY
ncbi:MAG TPA: leucine-rich repeat domain-containing protein [Bacteroidales bacterium]|nr:leucine-rich repeat domain-containing protein [Bacteroidales bacterium]